MTPEKFLGMSPPERADWFYSTATAGEIHTLRVAALGDHKLAMTFASASRAAFQRLATEAHRAGLAAYQKVIDDHRALRGTVL